MKKIFLSILLGLVTNCIIAQDFTKDVAAARTSYTSGNLEDTHFNLQQALQELDIIIGKEVLKLLPTALGTMNANTKDESVTSNVGFIGATIHRSYGVAPKMANLDIISNSPLVASLNSILNMPLIGGMMRDENNKTIKVQGYKSRLERSDAGDGKFDYKIDIPFSSALLTLSVNDTNESEITGMANKLPLKDIAQLIQ